MAWFDVYTRSGQKWMFRKRIIRSGETIDISELKKQLCSELGEQPGVILDPNNIKIVQPIELKEAKEESK